MGVPRIFSLPAVAAGLITAAIAGDAAASDAVTGGAASRLSPLCIDAAGITVSGVSSGGYMAQQLHVAHSRTIAGAAIFAAGPYLCAGDDYPMSLRRGLSVCADFLPRVPFQGPPDLQRSLDATTRLAAENRIDPPDGLARDRVYLFSGGRDTLVPRAVVDTLADYYRVFVDPAAIAYETGIDAAHAMVTSNVGGACDALAPPFVNNCGFDLAGAALRHLYGPLRAPAAGEDTGAVSAFDQREFAGGPESGLAARGYLFVPQACAAGARCRLHVAFHGCLQNADAVGEAFYTGAGYNRWATANAIVVLYPQTAASSRSLASLQLPWPNPQGCWDWWGFTGRDFATRDGRQVRAVRAMLERLQGEPGNPPRCAAPGG